MTAVVQLPVSAMAKSQSDATLGRSATFGGSLGGTSGRSFTAASGTAVSGKTGTGAYGGPATLGGYTSRPGGVFTSQSTGENRKLVKTASLPNLQHRLPNSHEA